MKYWWERDKGDPVPQPIQLGAVVSETAQNYKGHPVGTVTHVLPHSWSKDIPRHGTIVLHYLIEGIIEDDRVLDHVCKLVAQSLHDAQRAGWGRR